MINVDLHLHTRGSDGSDSAEEVISKAEKKGLDLISITDHDSIKSVPEGIEAGKKAGIAVIPGVEFSVAHDTEMHILGYFIDIENKAISEKLNQLERDRYERVVGFVKSLCKNGVDITLDDIKKRAFGGSLSRAHIADALTEKGYAKNKDEAFEKFLNSDSKSFVNKEKVSKEESIRLINDAGGIAVLAHPIYNFDEKFENVLDELLAFGLNGMEIFHPDHTDQQAKEFEEIAMKKAMLVTCGSDYHGRLKPEIEIGCETRTSEYLDYCINLFYNKALK